MSDYLQAASFIHAGKDWPFNASNHLKGIKIEKATHNFIHLVYSLPRKFMRSNAATFGDWQKNEEGSHKSQARKATFCWFLEFVNRLSKSSPKKKGRGRPSNDESKSDDEDALPDGDGVVVFFEVVKGENGGVVGERLHVFVNRGIVMMGTIFKVMLDIAQKKDNAKKMNFKEWEYHQRHVKTKEEYILNICNIYKGDTSCTDNIYESAALLDNALIKNQDASPTRIFSLNNFKIEGACQAQNDVNNYCDNPNAPLESTEWKFPREKLVVKRFWHQISPSYLWAKYLPSHQHIWVDLPEIHISTNEHDSLKFNAYVKPCPARCLIEEFMDQFSLSEISHTWLGLDLDQLSGLKKVANGRFIVHELKDTPAEVNINGWVRGNMIYDATLQHGHGSESMEYTERLKSKYQNQHSISAFDMIELETAYRMEFSSDKREVQEMMVDKFEQQCVSGDADISSAGKSIARWLIHVRKEMHDKFGSFEFEIKDPSLSPFGNMQYWFSQGLDTYMCVASAHPELIKLHYAVYDAYRQHGINQLHWNMIYTGESATSKSYIFEMMQLMSIPGTITEITYQTTRADAVDGDQNDHVTVFNEAPPGLFQANNKGEDAQKALSAMKEKLTSNRVRTKEFVRDEETGERKNRIAISSQIGCYVGATNDNPAEAEEAVKSRFHWGEFDRVFRQDKSIADYQRKAFEMESKPELREKYEEFLYYCQDQQMKVFYVWKFIFCGIMRDVDLDASNIVLSNIGKQLKKFDIRMPPRTTERFRILCRILTITSALDMVFNYKGGLHNGKPFELKQLLDVEPLLYCTEEIAVCALNMVAVEVPQLSVSRVKTLRAMWKIFQYSPMYKKDRDIITGTTEKLDYNYIRFTGGLKQLCIKIQNAIPYHQGKPSLHNIHSVIKELSSEPFRAHEYQCRDDFEAENPNAECMFEDTFAQPKKSSTGKKTAVAFASGNNFHDVHIGLFLDIRMKDSTKGTLMTECIKNIVHQKTKTRRIVTGIPDRSASGVILYPQFMQVLKLKADPTKKVPTIRNSNQETLGVKDMMGLSDQMLGTHDAIIMDCDTDTWAWSRRCITFLEMDKHDAFEYHPMALEESILVSKETLTYPDDLKDQKTGNQDVDNTVKIKASESMGIDLHNLARARKRRRIANDYEGMAIE